jgi:hypothetical protein
MISKIFGESPSPAEITLTVKVALPVKKFEAFDTQGKSLVEKVFTTPKGIIVKHESTEIEIEISKEVVEKDTEVALYLGGTKEKQPLIKEADNKIKGWSFLPAPFSPVVELKSNKKLKGEAKVSFSYPEKLEAAKINSLKILILDEKEKKWVPVEKSKVRFSKNKVTFTTSDLSFVARVSFVLSSNLEEVVVYPNPYYPASAQQGALKFINLPQGVKIKIYNICGEVVWEKETENTQGGVQWYAQNNKGEKVAPGIYLYLIQDKATGRKITGKFTLIR